jgi:hypothetical protein
MTIGLSRRSSVPALKLNPSSPIRFLPVSTISSMACWICIWLLPRIAWITGISRSTSLARYCSARTSFGRHEPPNANPGFM